MKALRIRLRRLSDFDAGDVLGPTFNVLDRVGSQWGTEHAMALLDTLEETLLVDVAGFAVIRTRLDHHEVFREARIAFADRMRTYSSAMTHLGQAIIANDPRELRRWQWIGSAYGYRVASFLTWAEQRHRATELRRSLPPVARLRDAFLAGLYEPHVERAEIATYPKVALHTLERCDDLVSKDKERREEMRRLQRKSDVLEAKTLEQCGEDAVVHSTQNLPRLSLKISALQNLLIEKDRTESYRNGEAAALQIATDLALGLQLPIEQALREFAGAKPVQ